jgi:hypothetical protein
MAAAFIIAKKNAQNNFRQAITSQEDGVEQNYRLDNFQKATSFRRPLQPPPRTETNLSDENDMHAAGCEKSAVGKASSRDFAFASVEQLTSSYRCNYALASLEPPAAHKILPCRCRQLAGEEALLRIHKVRLLQLQQTRGSERCEGAYLSKA